MELTEWQKEARNYYNEVFYKNNDDAHNLVHIDDVWNNAVNIISKQEDICGVNMDVMFMCVYCHDLFAGSDRKIHHVLAANYVLNNSDIFLSKFDKGMLSYIADAVFEHRASSKIDPSNWYSRVLRTADKGVLVLKNVILRSVQYNITTLSDVYKIVENVRTHILEKMGRGGYLYNDEYYTNAYREELEELWCDIDNMIDDDIRKVVIRELNNKG